MILEHADIRILPGRQTDFEEAIHRGIATVIAHSEGFRSARVHRGLESPERYLLLIEWNTLENHTVGFRQSPAYQAWRAIVGPFFASPPVVEHFATTTPGVAR